MADLPEIGSHYRYHSPADGDTIFHVEKIEINSVDPGGTAIRGTLTIQSNKERRGTFFWMRNFHWCELIK
jgi:hypothetical protein